MRPKTKRWLDTDWRDEVVVLEAKDRDGSVLSTSTFHHLYRNAAGVTDEGERKWRLRRLDREGYIERVSVGQWRVQAVP